MLKVIVADDEERICRLIKALVDWDSLGLEIAGIAGNGVEALDLIREYKPDILITDIRMPGCSGLELIEKVKKESPKTEIVIISGYAHFEYAQTAIKFGVGDYLLKPINREELTATLEKLEKKIRQRNASAENFMQLTANREKDICRLRKNLISDLMDQKEWNVSLEQVQKEYHLNLKAGVFQGMTIKIDGKSKELSRAAFQIIIEKAYAIIEKGLQRVCSEFVMDFKNNIGLAILNYPDRKQEEVRKILKDCLSQLEVQKALLGPVSFSIALGMPMTDVVRLPETVRQSRIMIAERLIKGTGCVMECALEPSSLNEKNFLEQYLRMVVHALEVLSKEETVASVEFLQASVNTVNKLKGYEMLELVESAASLFLTQVGCKDKAEAESSFARSCEDCFTQRMLFETLLSLQIRFITEKIKEHDNDASRPIRIARQYIQNHYSEQITLEEVSDVAGLSAAYFSTFFKKEMGEGFAKYLMNVRMEQAKILLRETTFSVAEVCKKTGYHDVKHFTHTFEKITGVKPGTYRKLYG